MVSVEKLNNILSGNFDAIETILEEVGVTDIHPNLTRREIRCSREEGRNPSSIRINIDTLYYKCFSTGEDGSIYSLIMDRLDKTFPQALKWVVAVLDLESSELKRKSIKLPFGGYFKKIIKQIEEPELNMKTYDEELLEEYSEQYSWLFNQDGISYDTQKYFKVGYDVFSNRITIPQWDINGNLVGIMGRLNECNAEKDKRWLPIVSCQRSLTLYGYHFNYRDIQREQICFIGESEKFVMQLRSMDIKNSLAVCGCDISNTQARYLKALMCKKYILCFDEGLTEDQIIKQAKKLKIDTPLYTNEVGYIYDKDRELLPSGSKASPTDMGLDVFEQLIETKVKWI